jgi:hypothetical protein
MNPRIRDTLLNALVCFVFAMLLLHVLEVGTVEVPLPAGDTPVRDEPEAILPFA